MNNSNSSSIDNLSFTVDDLEVFKIENVKECIISLQKHFFPRLDCLMDESLSLVERFYDTDIEDGMSKAYSPNNRLDAANNVKPESVMIGHTGKRRSKKNNKPLNINNPKGNPIYIHPAYLCYRYHNNGLFILEFTPFSHSVSPDFVEEIRRAIQEHISLILSNAQNIILNFASSQVVNIEDEPEKFKSLINTKNFGIDNAREFYQISFFIGIEAPIKAEYWDFFLKVFLFLYPLFDLCIAIGDGRESKWIEMMQIYEDIFLKENIDEIEIIEPKNEDLAKNSSFDDNSLSKSYELNIESAFDPESLEEAVKRKQMDVVQREGQQKFRADLLNVYKGKCTVTGCDVEAALDAAHIIDYSGIDSNHVQNGLLLRSDIHKLFDKKLITIDPQSMTILIAPHLVGTYYESLKNLKISLPENSDCNPSPDSLKRHNYDFMQKHYNYLIEKFKE